MPANPLTDPNWAPETTESIVRLVDNVRSRTTTPVIKLARGLVFGVMAVFLGTTALLLFLIGAIRGLQVLLELGMSRAQAVYTSYLVLGGIFCLVGLLLFRKRKQVATT